MKRLSACCLAIAFWIGPAIADTIDFETSGPAGAAPKDFSISLTGQGKHPVWQLQEAFGAPSGRFVVVQTSKDPTDNRFPLLVYDKVSAADPCEPGTPLRRSRSVQQPVIIHSDQGSQFGSDEFTR